MNPETDLQKFLRIALWVLSAVYMTGIILLFTPYTYNVDEIKVSIMISGGGVIWLFYGLYVYHAQARVRISSVMFPLLGFLLIFLASILAMEYRWIGWQMLAFYLFTMSMLFVAVATLTTFQRLIHACSLFVLLAFISCLFGFFHYLGGFGILKNMFDPNKFEGVNYWYNLFNTLDHSQSQMFGTILNTDFFAAYLIMALPAGFTLIFAAPQFYNRVLGFVTVVAMAGCIYLTQSNETMLAVLVFLIVFLAGYWFSVPNSILHRHWAVFLLMTVIWLGTIAFFTQNQIRDRFLHIGGAFNSRGIIWSGAWQMFLLKPIIGCGPGSFRIYFARYRDYDYWLNEISNVTLSPHNQAVDLLAEEGILGFAFYVWFLLAVCWLLISEIRKRPAGPLTVAQYSFLGGMIAIHIQNFFSPNYRWVAPATGYYFMMGLAIAAGQVSRIEAAELLRFGKLELWLNANRKIWAGALILAACCALTHYPVSGYNYFISAVYNNMGMLRMDEGDLNAKQVELVEAAKKKEAQERRDRRYIQASELFENSAKASPTFLTAVYKLAHSYNTRGMRVEALQVYNDLCYYNPDYSEVDFNYGIVFRLLYMYHFQLDRKQLAEYAKVLAERKKFKFTLDYARLADAQQLTAEEQRQLALLVTSITKRDPQLRDLELKKLVTAGGAEMDPLLMELSLYYLTIASRQAHKPQVWLSYIEALQKTGRLEEAAKEMTFVFSNEPEKTGHIPINKWWKTPDDSFDALRPRFINLQLQIYLEMQNYSELLVRLHRRVKEAPNDLVLFNTMLFMIQKYSPEEYHDTLPLIAYHLSRNPLDWRVQMQSAKFFFEVRQLSFSMLCWLRAIECAKNYPPSKLIPAVAEPILFEDQRTPNLAEIYYQVAQVLTLASQRTANPELKPFFLACAKYYLQLITHAPLNEEYKAQNTILIQNAKNALRALDEGSAAVKETSPQVDLFK